MSEIYKYGMPISPLTTNIPSRVVIISAVHDYRMKRRGSIQAIAEALRDAGSSVTFLSIRFSGLSKYKGDPRQDLLKKANKAETVDGICCYLWRTTFHPFGVRKRWLNVALTPLFWLYPLLPSRELDEFIRKADVVVIESGLGIILARRIRRLNSGARLIYRASDRLQTIYQHPFVERSLERTQGLFAYFCLLGPGMASDFVWAFPQAYLLPPALDARYIAAGKVSPYTTEKNAIALGPMLFDPTFFEAAGPLFPAVTFHIFGAPVPSKAIPANVKYHQEIPHLETAKFVQHASIGVAPYRAGPGVEYLADTSSKLSSYAAFGLPAVCPNFAVGHHFERFGYEPGDSSSIQAAVAAALAAGPQSVVEHKTWADTVERLLEPHLFQDTDLAGRIPLPSLDEYSRIGGAACKISLIIATRWRQEPLRRLFDSLRLQETTQLDIIVVDQNEAGYLDAVVGAYPDLPIRRIRSEVGVSLARNKGLAFCDGSIVGFPDDDCWYRPGFLADLIRFFRLYPDVDIVMGQTVDTDLKPSLSPVRREGGLITAKNICFSGKLNSLFLRGTLARSLTFDVTLGVGAPTPYQSGEEVDFVLAALKQGANGVYAPRMTVFHEQADLQVTLGEIRRTWKYSVGFGRVLRTRYSLTRSIYRVLHILFSSTLCLIQGHPRRAIYTATWALGTVRGFLF